MNTLVGEDARNPETRKLIASPWHTVLLLGFLALPLISGLIVQGRHTAGGQIFASHSTAMIRFYLPVLIYEWFLVLFVWFGIRKTGTTLSQLIGGRWQRQRDLARDVALGVAMWVLLLAVGTLLSNILGPEGAKSINIIMPRGGLETAIWIAVASTAGFVEELVFRGYLQTQLIRMRFPVILAIVTQAVIFSLGHAYEGRNAVIEIAVYAILFGILAAWRRSLRPGMIGHICYDVSAMFLMGR